ncbi:penicillin-binding protein 2 [Kitasatospora purpeofusca]|uniref:penicillin-binding protein 2 n=1 Tax=Kitasatospora purpeofusca TaxID=67352 RepID=UPI002A5A418F|nr:penicillin-binding protein 2 [Kitasatospora purpeofusca]MDY0815120.1 penicillin-binding protein 2 [Kitasatospora purpeofusca]
MSNIPETGRTRRVTIRLVVLQILVVSLLATLGGRLWYLQIRNASVYTAKATGNHIREVVEPAVRGEILDASGRILAGNETKLVVSVSRTSLLQQKDAGKAVLTRLAEVLGMPAKDVQEKVRLCDAKTPQPCWNGSPYQPIPVTKEATTQQAMQIMERREDFPGITAQPTAVRHYTGAEGANLAQVLGYLSPVTDDEVSKTADKAGLDRYLPADQIGRAGLESVYDRDLRGTAGVTKLEVDNLGRVIGTADQAAPQTGNNLVTSIDARVQKVVEDNLAQAMSEARKTFDKVTNRNYEADSGAAVVMDVHTGRIVAMASAPTYDPNLWQGGISGKDYQALTSKETNFPLLNRAIQGQSAPGSTFKVISTTAAVQAGYSLDGRYDCPKSMTIGGREFKNFESESFGAISLERALEVSCDTVFYGLAYDQWMKDGGIKPKKDPGDWFFKTAHQFGLGAKTGIDLPSEVPGRVPDRQWKQSFYDNNKDAWCKQAEKGGNTFSDQIARENCVDGYQMRAGDAVNFAIGQGDTLVTPVQMARIYSALANGGTFYRPTVAKAVISPGGDLVREIAPHEDGRLPGDQKLLGYIDQATAGVVTGGTAAWKFTGAGWPQGKIELHAKTGTAEVEGKQTTSWLTTYSRDYAVVMTISQGGTGSGGSGDAIRRIYQSLYGVDDKGNIDQGKALLPKPQAELPKFNPDGTAIIKPASFDASAGSAAPAGSVVPAVSAVSAGSAVSADSAVSAVPVGDPGVTGGSPRVFLDPDRSGGTPVPVAAAVAAVEPTRSTTGRGRA